MPNGKPNFWIDSDAKPTEGFNCGNSEVWATSISFQNGQSRGICNTDLKEWIDIPVDYDDDAFTVPISVPAEDFWN